MELRGSDELATAIGRVAIADAAADEWLMQLLGVLLWPLHPDAVRILVARDSASLKVDKSIELLALSSLADERLPGSEESVATVLRKSKKVKEDRDRTIHSYYEDAAEPGSPIRRFRSRSKQISAVTVDQLDELHERLMALVAFLERLTVAIEDRRAHEQAREGDRAAILEDCRELLLATPLHLSEEQLRALRSTDPIRVARSGPGSWRALAADESPANGESLVILNPGNGQITVTTPDGETLHGGDTGWRDVTELARADEPDVERALLRRIHGSVRVMQQGGSMLHGLADAAVARTLDDRTFGPTTPEYALPSWLQHLDGFRPTTPQ